MKTGMVIIAALAIASLLGGCIVYTPPDPNGPDFYRPAYNQPARVEIIHSDIEWLVWEYYDWDYDIVYNLHYRYGYTQDEICLVLFLAHYGRVEPIRIVQWRQANTPWMTITTYHLRLQPDIFFVPVSPAYRFGPPYGNAYGRYWKNPKEVVLTDSEMINLVYLKTTCQAYNVSPVEVIKLHEQGRDFNHIVRVHRSEGRHIRTTKGREIKEPPARVKIKPVGPYKGRSDKDKNNPAGHTKDKPDGTSNSAEKEKPKTNTKPPKDKGKGTDKPKENKGKR